MLLHKIERQLDECERRAELLCERLSYVAELEYRIEKTDEHRALKLAYLRDEHRRLIDEIRMMLEAASRLDVDREMALNGEID
ncbi:hypothetical protein [Bosea sp. (in: a-proteobacteria)]|uniref:hypothetical protein n=1 Tax=Bosea sp. (in: a-proteobacteria) TaxID=1871050 RepID=UPI003B3ADCB7